MNSWDELHDKLTKAFETAKSNDNAENKDRSTVTQIIFGNLNTFHIQKNKKICNKTTKKCN